MGVLDVNCVNAGPRRSVLKFANGVVFLVFPKQKCLLSPASMALALVSTYFDRLSTGAQPPQAGDQMVVLKKIRGFSPFSTIPPDRKHQLSAQVEPTVTGGRVLHSVSGLGCLKVSPFRKVIPFGATASAYQPHEVHFKRAAGFSSKRIVLFKQSILLPVEIILSKKGNGLKPVVRGCSFSKGWFRQAQPPRA